MEKRPRKRRAVEQSKAKVTVSELSDESQSESNESLSSDFELQVDFEGKAIQRQDADGIRLLLHQLFLKADVNLDELVEVIVSQDNIGSTIKLCAEEGKQEEKDEEKQEDDEDEEQVCGIATVINLNTHKEKSCTSKLLDHLLNQSREHNSSGHAQFSQLVKAGSGQLGLLINVRFLNIPAHLVVPLFKSLRSEMDESCEKGLPYNFQHYVVVARTHQAPCALGHSKAKKARPSAGEEGGGGSIIFDHFECELMHQESTASFSYPVSEEADYVIGGTWSFDDQAMKPFRTVMVIPAAALDKVVVLLEEGAS